MASTTEKNRSVWIRTKNSKNACEHGGSGRKTESSRKITPFWNSCASSSPIGINTHPLNSLKACTIANSAIPSHPLSTFLRRYSATSMATLLVKTSSEVSGKFESKAQEKSHRKTQG